MKYDVLIVRYGEIALKGRETRRRFENILIKNIKVALKSEKITFNIKWEWGRIFVYTKQINETIKVLKKIFGIISISPAGETNADIDSISNHSLNIAKDFLTKKDTFAIRVNRTGGHSFTSQDVAIRVGNDIVNLIKSGVNLTSPDFELFIDIRNDKSYFYLEKIYGPGGMPLGTQGSILSLIDKSNSILSSWYLMKRGCFSIFVCTDPSLKKVIEDFTKKWYTNSIIFEINQSKNLFKEINKIAMKNNCKAIVTGHNLGENSEDVLSQIKEFKKYLVLPVLHPLISMNVEEINNKKKEIGI